ncbi:UNVERIFIED_CONTAM: putative disease resistance RPP13-like protein 3 [Sesamum latifolium]|uniref:Disease resistance RPP13-like protein 3 n=1 Tax=Sesamum latifolium TaxID=2727402 RepID=A0AAW2TC27_9LAMI
MCYLHDSSIVPSDCTALASNQEGYGTSQFISPWCIYFSKSLLQVYPDLLSSFAYLTLLLISLSIALFSHPLTIASHASNVPNLDYPRHADSMGHHIHTICLTIIRRIKDLGGGMNLSGRSEDGGKRQLTPWQKDKHLVGLEGEVQKLIGRAVLNKWEGLSIATIVGMGGIGKSTLAREVYNYAAVATQFDCRAWAVFSREFNPREIIKSLMLQLVKQDKQREMLEIMEKSNLQNVKNMLHQQLQGKRYFLVLDDVWQDEAWESFAPAFPDEDKASRLLLTNRIQGIAKYARYNHKMNFLNPDESWELFLKKAFIDDTNGKCPQHLEDIGRAIVEKCDGLPLAITVVGGLLVKKRQSVSEWEKVLKGLESHSGRSEILPTLELSYHELPPQLKSCFLVLRLFQGRFYHLRKSVGESMDCTRLDPSRRNRRRKKDNNGGDSKKLFR